jgi:hypothetical protein
VKQQHTSTATSKLTTKSTYRILSAQRLSERTVQLTTVTMHKHSYAKNIIFWYKTKNDMPQRHHKCDLNLHYHATVCCAAGMLMCQPIIFSKCNPENARSCSFKKKKLNLLPTNHQSGTQHVSTAPHIYKPFTSITITTSCTIDQNIFSINETFMSAIKRSKLKHTSF